MTDKKKDNFIKKATHQTKGYLDVYSKREMWDQIAKELNGEFRVGFNSGHEIEIHRLFIPYKNWELKISESDTRPLKFEIDFSCRADFDLIIGWEDSIDKLLKRFGKREIQIGNEEFDNYYLIKSRFPNQTIKFFSQEIIDYLLSLNVYSISYQTNILKNTSNLISVISRTIDDKETIIELIQLFKCIIDRLEELNILQSNP